jgi:hypothetical protein
MLVLRPASVQLEEDLQPLEGREALIILPVGPVRLLE